MKKFAFAAVSALAMVAAAPASAAEIVYSFAGTFSGTAGGQTFTAQDVTFNATGDTATARTVGGLKVIDLSSVTASMGGAVVFNLSELTSFVVLQSNNAAGIVDRALTKQYFAFAASGLSTYDGTTSFATTTALAAEGTTEDSAFASVAGPSTITSITNLRFSAAANAAAVPEPATWGMMLLGFGLAGASMRSRRRSTSVRFA